MSEIERVLAVGRPGAGKAGARFGRSAVTDSVKRARFVAAARHEFLAEGVHDNPVTPVRPHADAPNSHRSGDFSLHALRAMMAFTPPTVQCIPARLSRVATTSLQPASTTPLEVHSHMRRNRG